MILKFMNRNQERRRLKRLIKANGPGMACIYGRRRCGKSRLLREILPVKKAVYFVGDEREAPLQRMSLAAEMARIIPDFDAVAYPDWDSLLKRWWKDAPEKAVLVFDEFPYLVKQSPELPSIIQKYYDINQNKTLKLIICGSSQTMMYGLVLNADAPLYGRANEILKIEPLTFGWINKGFNLSKTTEALTAFTLWGGIPRYWELAADFNSVWSAYKSLVLDSMGVFHSEPERLLHEDLRDTAQSTSILSLIGHGCNRISEVAGRLEKPVTSLARPFRKLIDLGLIRKDIPFNADPKSTKQALYFIADPFLATWYRHVLPNRSLLERGVVDPVAKSILGILNRRKAEVWEDLARESIPYLRLFNRQWFPAYRWWGTSVERSRIELDVISESTDGKRLLVGEVKLSANEDNLDRLLFELERKANILPFSKKYEGVDLCLFIAEYIGKPSPKILTIDSLLKILK